MLALSRILEFATPLGERAEWGRISQLPFDACQQQIGPISPDLKRRLGNTGQRRAGSVGKREIIKCGQGNIIRAPDALFVHGVKEAERHRAIRNKNRLAHLTN